MRIRRSGSIVRQTVRVIEAGLRGNDLTIACIDQSGLAETLRPTFARYTGQESQEERERIREQKSDILLTNFMMLELLMTRQNPLDRAVIAASVASRLFGTSIA
jgi:hypothetical protein